MLHVALANIKTYARRYIAVILAVAIGTAFLAATLAVNTSTRATLKNSLGDTYKNADLVAFQDWELAPDDPDFKYTELGLKQVQQIRELPQISTAYGTAFVSGELRTADDGYGVMLQPVSAEQNLGGMELLEGRAPLNSNEIILDDEHAQKMLVSVGDTVGLTGADSATRDVKVVGIQRTSTDPMLSGYALVGMQESAWEKSAGESAQFQNIVIDARDSVPAAQQALAAYLAEHRMIDVSVMTADEKVINDVAMLTDGTDQLTIVLLVFALVALVVTGLVVVNTFNVVIAQRTRELALLRTLGAKRQQIRSSVLIEALVIGVVASLLGVALAVALMAGLIQLVHVMVPSMSYATLALNTTGLVVPVVVGILMTVIAASLPARRAMKLAPLAALRPFDAASVKNRAGKLRIVFGILLTLAGGGLLAWGAIAGSLPIAFGGGLLSFPGILMLASLFVPASVFGIGKLVAGRSVAGKLAALNAVRNPGRTTATATALLIGVTLVSMIMVGGQTAKASLNNSIAGEYPVDLTVSLYERAVNEAKTQDLARELGSLDGIEETSTFLAGSVETKGGDNEGGFSLMGVDPQTFSKVVLDQNIVPEDGQIIRFNTGGEEQPKKLTVGGRELDVKVSSASLFQDLVTKDTLESLKTGDAADEYAGVLIKVAPDLSNSEITALVEQIADVANVESYMVSGGVVENAMFSQVIDVLLAIVSALLAVAVLIALIGVANTLSLSVLERTRENSLLRALGLKKKQLRAMLAQEAVLIGGVAALLGLVLGVVYGLLGAHATLSAIGEMSYEIPWLQLALVLVVSIVAALLASVTPGRRAAKLSPVQGLATE
ncbi:ABC transporter permease [Glutamicibacter protophormiae]|uniref:ABC transport system permease protein n=1 Tax=Glutamicibacter protophormiae TaxID=37930 RepID=A0ABS4XQF2_GLUPR|nr:ABC transporter permease [Glutamicibacter protophormiae]MBP2398502.1 putative ABC transport system permease protein [Glutamicibacter protophormiae]GGL94848.1 ABC transporter permease [Glutamicibacter protophormiae]